MDNLAILVRQYGLGNLAVLVVGLAIGLAALSAPVHAQSSADDSLSAAKTEALTNYEAAKAAGRHAEATKYILDYMESTEGENDPQTVALTHRYGNLLRTEGDIREAVSVLKMARQRGIIAFGEYGIQLFEINLDLGDAYVDRDIGVGIPKKYFDDALEVLRQNGQRETTLYVRALVGIASRLTQAGVLDGAYSAETRGDNAADLVASGLTSVTHDYESGYRVLEEYMREAVELAAVLHMASPRFLVQSSC